MFAPIKALEPKSTDEVRSNKRGELKQLKSAGLLVVHKESFPFVDLRVDLNSQPLVEMRFLWELYEPSADNYVVRAVDPDKAPGAG